VNNGPSRLCNITFFLIKKNLIEMGTSSHFSNKQIKCDNDNGHISFFGGHILDLVKWVNLLYYSFLKLIQM